MSLKSSISLQHTDATPRTPVALARAAFAASLLLALLAAAPLAAQQAPAVGKANGNANANAPPAAAADRAAAARAANDRLRGAGEEDSLFGAPAAYRDPYRSALDAGDMQQSDLMRAERVPNGATIGNEYAPLPPGGGMRAARAAGAGAGEAGNEAAGGGGGTAGGGGPGMAIYSPGGKAAPNTAQTAQPLYRDPYGGVKGNGGQVYRSPW